MAKGTTAKINVVKTLQKAFGADYIGEGDKKYYVWADDGGERVQIAISLTCPKIYLEVEDSAPAPSFPNEGIDFEASAPPQEAPPLVITPEEDAKLEELMKKLGLM